MNFDSYLETILRRANQKAFADRTCAYLHAQMDANAYRAWQEHGDAYAGMDHRGNVILWRKTSIPKAGKSKNRGHEKDT